MYNLNQICDVHLEITSKCQARCPMCPRRIQGGPINPNFELNEISLETFKKWFPIEFIIQLRSLFMCGGLGDPIIAADTLEIFQYIRSINSKIILTMHTNGSARNKQWWIDLAKTQVNITFGIDGLEDTHALYRVDTNYNQILKNAKTFIDAGGKAFWKFLAFKHNEHQIEECRHTSKELGFEEFNVLHTGRYLNKQYQSLNIDGTPAHILYPTDTSLKIIKLIEAGAKFPVSSITCKAKAGNQIYVAADGKVTPCCWLNVSWKKPDSASRYDFQEQIGEHPNLHDNTLQEIFDSGYFKKIESTWVNKPLVECSQQCGNVDKAGIEWQE